MNVYVYEYDVNCSNKFVAKYVLMSLEGNLFKVYLNAVLDYAKIKTTFV